MAKIDKMPSLAIISGFKGTLDFYLNMGLACVRRWPRSPGKQRAPAVEAQWSSFSLAASLWSSLSDEVRYTYNKMSSGTGYSGRDLFTRAYIKGLYPYPTGV